ncbi:carbohydrate-binding protein [Agarivorans sp. 1_MG-2023]|uniref:carbohydrate-binding protein n=1 Tax=Agarivorans sp. 1_MG-2023 TaxID=3062634 RepID=UPI0026E298D3|nr:carbohydrate-binding protein [Agarivorans sp. 1_MG-2023]MDO6763318.1 carbohydrate-binding protein [Agarivorans sp. 1_MG-2023]
MNKILTIIKIAAAGLAFIVSGAQAAEEVRLRHAQFTPYFENGFASAELEGAVEVKNIGPNKQVWIHYQTSDGQWLDHPAFYIAATSNGYEAFSFRLPLQGSVSATQFAIKYQVNGDTYWDNNKQQNYQFDATTQTHLAHQAVALDEAYRESSLITVTARALASGNADKVTMVYSDTNWQHSYRTNLTLSHTVADGNGLSGVWTGQQYIEYYRRFEFYLEYQDGQNTVIDNYYGKNYRLFKTGESLGRGELLQRYPQVYFRGEPSGWNSLPMSLIDDYTWSTVVYFDGTTDFKFDIYNDWSRNFGDDTKDGFANLNGANMQVDHAGSIRITFNSLTGAYQATPVN